MTYVSFKTCFSHASVSHNLFQPAVAASKLNCWIDFYTPSAAEIPGIFVMNGHAQSFFDTWKSLKALHLKRTIINLAQRLLKVKKTVFVPFTYVRKRLLRLAWYLHQWRLSKIKGVRVFFVHLGWLRTQRYGVTTFILCEESRIGEKIKMRKEVSVLKEVFVQKSLVDRLRELLRWYLPQWGHTPLAQTVLNNLK